MKENDEKFSVPKANLFFFTCEFLPKIEITNKFFENEVVLEFQLLQVRGGKKNRHFSIFGYLYVCSHKH